MTTLIEQKLKQAIKDKEDNITSFVWRGEKKLDRTGNYVQEEVKLVDMTESKLANCYDHCKRMLFNKDS